MQLCGGLQSDTAETNVHSIGGFRNPAWGGCIQARVNFTMHGVEGYPSANIFLRFTEKMIYEESPPHTHLVRCM